MSDVDGVWDTVTNTPMGQQKGTATLKTDGDKLTGTLSGAQGTVELQDGKVDGNNVSWKLDISQPMPLTLEFSAAVEGDEISGSVKLGAFGTASFQRHPDRITDGRQLCSHWVRRVPVFGQGAFLLSVQGHRP